MLSGSEYPNHILFNFENNSTVLDMSDFSLEQSDCSNYEFEDDCEDEFEDLTPVKSAG